MGMYIFPIKCSHWPEVSQNLTWKRVRGWPAAGMGCERRREQARGGSMISEGNDPTPSLLVAQSASRSGLAEPAERRAVAQARSGRAPAWPSSSRPRVLLPRRRLQEAPQERPRWGSGLAPAGQAREPRSLSHRGAPRRGRGAASSEVGSEARGCGRRERRGRGDTLACPLLGRATLAARVLGRKAPPDQALAVILHYSC